MLDRRAACVAELVQALRARSQARRRAAGSAPSTCCACACFALTDGSPVAVPAATTAAARARRSAGACRFRTLITDSQTSLAAGAPEGPVRHKFGRLAGVSDTCNQITRAKLLHLAREPSESSPVVDRTKSPNLRFTVLRSRPRARPEDTIRGAARRCLWGALASRHLRSRRPPQGRFAAPQLTSALQARTHRALLDLYALDTRLRTAQTQLTSLQRTSSAARAPGRPARAATLGHAAHADCLTASAGRRICVCFTNRVMSVRLPSCSERQPRRSRVEARRAEQLRRREPEGRRHDIGCALQLARLRRSLADRRALIDTATREAERTATALTAARTDRRSLHLAVARDGTTEDGADQRSASRSPTRGTQVERDPGDCRSAT